MKLTEHQIQSQILQYLEIKKIFHWRNNSGATVSSYTNKAGETKNRFIRYGAKGSADIICIHAGKCVLIEVKSKTGKLTPEQKTFLSNAEKSGAICIVARSLDDVITKLG